MAVVGVRTTGNIQQERRVVDMAKEIALLDPKIAPFITILKRIKGGGATRVVHSPEFKWLEDDYVATSTTAAATAEAGATAITVADGSIFRVNDIVKVPATGETMLVTAVSGNNVTVTRSWGDTEAAQIPNAAELLNIGSAMSENSLARARVSTQEVVRSNYTQIFRTPFELSRTEDFSEMYGGKDRAYQRRKALAEHKRDIARAIYFGEKAAGVDAVTGAPKRTMGGLIEAIKKDGLTHGFSANGTELTYANFNANVAKRVFEHGSDEKLLVCGGKLAAAIDSWDIGAARGDMGADKTYGVHVTKLITSYGILDVVYDPLLTGETYGGYGLVLDMDNIRYAHLAGSDTKLRTNIQPNDQDGVMDEYLTECSVEIKLPKTHMLITGAYV